MVVTARREGNGSAWGNGPVGGPPATRGRSTDGLTGRTVGPAGVPRSPVDDAPRPDAGTPRPASSEPPASNRPRIVTVHEDWDTFRVDGGWCYDYSINGVPFHAYGETWIRVHNVEVATVYLQTRVPSWLC